MKTSHYVLLCAIIPNSVLKTRAILLFTIKIIEMFELHASMPPMRSAEYQATIPLKLLIIIHNYANETINQSKSLPGFRVVVTSLDGINGWSIQTLLRGETTLSNRMKFRRERDTKLHCDVIWFHLHHRQSASVCMSFLGYHTYPRPIHYAISSNRHFVFCRLRSLAHSKR